MSILSNIYMFVWVEVSSVELYCSVLLIKHLSSEVNSEEKKVSMDGWIDG